MEGLIKKLLCTGSPILGFALTVCAAMVLKELRPVNENCKLVESGDWDYLGGRDICTPIHAMISAMALSLIVGILQILASLVFWAKEQGQKEAGNRMDSAWSIFHVVMFLISTTALALGLAYDGRAIIKFLKIVHESKFLAVYIMAGINGGFCLVGSVVGFFMGKPKK